MTEPKNPSHDDELEVDPEVHPEIDPDQIADLDAADKQIRGGAPPTYAAPC